VVRRGLPDGSEGSRFADMAIDELLRMHELAESLLDLNRPSDPFQGTCDPVEVAGQVATLAGFGDEPVRVTVRAEAPDVRMAVPPDALKQILFNLVENAREAGGGVDGVEIRVATIPDGVRLDVLDRGPGIPEDALPKLFDPFFTTKHAVHGVGLGLFVAEGLVRRYGGRMEAANRADGPGARFTVEAPGAGREVRA
jgi:signal transduction histidine kinase